MASLIAGLGLVCAGLVAAQAPAPDSVACVPLAQAIGDAGLTRLQTAVQSVLGEASAAALAAVATVSLELSDDQKLTIFAPEDKAWPVAAMLPTGGDLADVLLGHVVDDYLPSTDISMMLDDSQSKEIMLTTLPGSMAVVSKEGQDIYIAADGQEPPGAKVIKPDIESCVGVIHIIDKLLMADAMAPGPAALAPRSFGVPIGADAPLIIDPLGEAPAPLVDEEDTAPVGAAGASEALAPGAVQAGDTDGASHMVAGIAASAVAAALMLLA